MTINITAKTLSLYILLLGILTAFLVVFYPIFVTRTTTDTASQADLNLASTTAATGKMALNVLKKPLALHSTSPMTGFLRNGYCEVPPSDYGNHAVAAIVTDDFLSFSAARGNDLRTIGLKGGCKWCLCASRWKEAFDARKSDNDSIVPKVVLNATNSKALDKIELGDLKRFAVDKEGE